MAYTREQAQYEARRQVDAGLPARAVKTRHWSVDLWQWVSCWTVVLGS